MNVEIIELFFENWKIEHKRDFKVHKIDTKAVNTDFKVIKIFKLNFD